MIVVTILLSAVIGGALGFFIRQAIYKNQQASSESLATRIIGEAKKEAENIKKESLLQAKENLIKVKSELEKESKERKLDLDALEKRIRTKEEQYEKRMDVLSQKETVIESREKSIAQKEQSIHDKQERLNRGLQEQKEALERIAGISSEEAKNMLVASMESEARVDAASLVRKIEDEAKRLADKKSQEIIAYAVQRYSGDYIAENTVSVVNLPNDEMKGRIIGREGRNIRAIEAATGIDLIVDDTPEAVVLSSFDPVRREVARISLERLISDGRIHPGGLRRSLKKSERKSMPSFVRRGNGPVSMSVCTMSTPSW